MIRLVILLYSNNYKLKCNIRGDHGGHLFYVTIIFGQLFQSGSGAALENLAIFMSISLRPCVSLLVTTVPIHNVQIYCSGSQQGTC